MNINQLVYFIEVSEIQHFSNAADNLHISEPALSKTISRLENELNTRLFDRTGRNIKLSKTGKKFLPYARAAVEATINGIDAINKVIDNENNQIIIQSISMVIFPGLLKRILSISPDIEVRGVNTPAHIQENSLLSGLTDICLTQNIFKSNYLNQNILANTKLLVVVPTDHKFASKPYVTFSNILSEKIIGGTKYTGLHNNYDLLFRNSNVKPPIGITISNINEVLLYVSHKKGLAILSETSYHDLQKREHHDITAVALLNDSLEPYQIPYFIYWRKKNNSHNVIDIKNEIIDYFNVFYTSP